MEMKRTAQEGVSNSIITYGDHTYGGESLSNVQNCRIPLYAWNDCNMVCHEYLNNKNFKIRILLFEIKVVD